MSGTSFTLRRGIAETAVVVLGVLIALGVDSAWAWRMERIEEHEALERLYVDFTATLGEIEEEIANYETQRGGLARVLEAISDGGVPAGSGELPDEVLFGAYGTVLLTPPSGALTSLIASGQIGILRNDELRNRLTAWFDLLHAAQNEDAEDRRIYEQVQFPLLWPRAPLRDVFVGAPDAEGLEASRLPHDENGLLRSLEFESLLTWRYMNAAEALSRYADLDRAVRHILDLIADDLGS